MQCAVGFTILKLDIFTLLLKSIVLCKKSRKKLNNNETPKKLFIKYNFLFVTFLVNLFCMKKFLVIVS